MRVMYKTTEISEILGVKPGTVRKYAGALEAAGYSVTKSGSGHRDYSEEDATAFRELQALCQRSGMTVDVAAEVVAARRLRASESVAPAVISPDNARLEHYEKRYNEILEIAQRQADELERVHKRMDEQNAHISVILREVLETRRMVAASQDRKWWQIWRKNLALPDLEDPETVWKLHGKGKL